MPNRNGVVTASSESGFPIIRLSSACPAQTVRPHMQDGSLLVEYPRIADSDRNSGYSMLEMDFARRLIAKFKLELDTFFWKGKTFHRLRRSIYPKEYSDPSLLMTQQIKSGIGNYVYLWEYFAHAIHVRLFYGDDGNMQDDHAHRFHDR